LISVNLDESEAMKFSNLDNIDNNPNPKSYYLIGTIGIGVCREWNWTHYDLNNPYIPIEEGIISMLNERDGATDNSPLEEVDNTQVGDVVVNKVGFRDAKSALVTCKQLLDQNPSDVTPLIQSI
jgi:hypothetical protein